MNRFLRILILLVWLELGLVLLLVPWSDFWEINYFLYQYPGLRCSKNAFFRGAVSGLGVMNIFMALEEFRRRTNRCPPHLNLPRSPQIVCYVTDRKSLDSAACPHFELAREIRAAVAAGVDWVQIREKDLPARELLDARARGRSRQAQRKAAMLRSAYS